MNKVLFTFLSVLLLGAGVSQAQTIAPAEKRQSLLEGMHATLENVEQEPGDYKDVESPFVPRNRKTRQPSAPVENIRVETVAPAERLPDTVALRVIGERFNPIGSLVMGNRGVLQLANGEILPAGQTFPARIQGNTYHVLISEVTSNGYTLILGEASIRKNFITTNGATQ